MSFKSQILKLAKFATFYILRSECLKHLAFSKTMWGLLLFFAVGVIFTIQKLWTTEVLEYFKWLGPFFFVSRGMDNLSNIVKINK